MTDELSNSDAEQGVNFAPPDEPPPTTSGLPTLGMRLFAIPGAGKTGTAGHYARAAAVHADADQPLSSTSK